MDVPLILNGESYVALSGLFVNSSRVNPGRRCALPGLKNAAPLGLKNDRADFVKRPDMGILICLLSASIIIVRWIIDAPMRRSHPRTRRQLVFCLT